MKKVFLFSVLLLMSFAVVSAYNFVGDEVLPECASTMETSDLEFSDGNGVYVYCTYSMEVNGVQEDFGTFPLAWGMNPDGSNEFEQTHYCGRCYQNGTIVPYTLTEGVTEWNSYITKGSVHYDEQEGKWVEGDVVLLDEVNQVWSTIPEPSDDFLRNFIQKLLGNLCRLHEFSFCTI